MTSYFPIIASVVAVFMSSVICAQEPRLPNNIVKMPGKSYTGPLPALTRQQKQLCTKLKKHVSQLADVIGERNLIHYDNLNRAADYILQQFRSYGYTPSIQSFHSPRSLLSLKWEKTGYQYQKYKNIIAEIKGTEKPDEIIVIGSHYDSVPIKGCRGANDNASGVAATLALAEYFFKHPVKRTLRFVGFANEEPPFFRTKGMGSYVYAESCCEKKEKIIGMLTPETIGYYSNNKNSQKYPSALSRYYPTTGNFIAFVGNSRSRELVTKCVGAFRKYAKFPSEGACLPMVVPMVGASDHYNFWLMDYPGLMITDTAPFRYKAYHTSRDNTKNIDFPKMTLVVDGLKHVIKHLSNSK